MKPRLVYVGCGHHRMAGFIHVEIGIGKDKSGPPDILADITDYIPLDDSSVDLIFSRATLEHLTYRELMNHFLECYRILKKGGCVRMVVPNFDMMIKEYENKVYWPGLEKNPDLPNENYVDTFVAMVLYHDHYYLHNFNTLSRALLKSGFTDVRECDPGDTKIKPAREEIFKAEISRRRDIIIEATKSDKKPVVKRYERVYPGHPIKKILAKYFNISISSFIKRRPYFPQKSWFKEKLAAVKKVDLDNIKHETGSHGQKPIRPKYEDKLDLRLLK